MKAASLTLMILLAAQLSAGTKTFVGSANPATSWDRADNWNPAGLPTADDTAYIAFANPYVEITSPGCVAHTVIVQAGGRLALKGGNDGRELHIIHDLIIEEGGVFNTASTGNNGPVVFIGGNVICNGLWDLSGVGVNTPGVVFDGIGTQRISGTGTLTFQNLTNSPNDSLIVDGVNIGILGSVDPSTGFTVITNNGGTVVVGGPPLTVSLAWISAVPDTSEPGVALIRWQSKIESASFGYTLERRRDDASLYDTVAAVAPSGAAPNTYTVLDGPLAGGTWHYRLSHRDTLGRSVVPDSTNVVLSTLTAVEASSVPTAFVLSQNYPNPFNPGTVVKYQLPAFSYVRLKVYDLLGREVATLVEGEQPAGEYDVAFDASALASGAYIYRLSTERWSDVKRMMLLR